jgi:hypothetical protein
VCLLLLLLPAADLALELSAAGAAAGMPIASPARSRASIKQLLSLLVVFATWSPRAWHLTM